MRLDEFLESVDRDEDAERRRLAAERSYAVTEYLEEFEERFDSVGGTDTVFGSTAPSIFVGRSNYPQVPTGLLSPVGNESTAASFVTDSTWYSDDLSIADVMGRRSALLNANRSYSVTAPAKQSQSFPNVADRWDGFLGVQREVAIADRPVDIELGLADRPELTLNVDDIAEPTGPWATASSAELTENPHVPRAVEKTLSDDDWRAEGAMTYLYRRDFDVYDIHRILSAGALGESQERRLVPTRWSITAVDDTIGDYLRGGLRNASSINQVEVWHNEFIGNAYWVLLAPGNWEFELVEIKAPGSVWNPEPAGTIHIGTDYEGYEGRSAYVEETAGAYHASRLGVLEHLQDRDRQAKALVIRHVSDEYWGPVGVWQVRESVRNAFDSEPGTAPSLGAAVAELAPHLPVSLTRLQRHSTLVSAQQQRLDAFSPNNNRR